MRVGKGQILLLVLLILAIPATAYLLAYAFIYEILKALLELLVGFLYFLEGVKACLSL